MSEPIRLLATNVWRTVLADLVPQFERASGMHFTRLVERLGIAAEIRAMAKTHPGGLVGELVARGEAEE